jgi:hypothetical protein
MVNVRGFHLAHGHKIFVARPYFLGEDFRITKMKHIFTVFFSEIKKGSKLPLFRLAAKEKDFGSLSTHP